MTLIFTASYCLTSGSPEDWKTGITTKREKAPLHLATQIVKERDFSASTVVQITTLQDVHVICNKDPDIRSTKHCIRFQFQHPRDFAIKF